MRSTTKPILIALIALGAGLFATRLASGQVGAPDSHSQPKDRARVLFSTPLSRLDGDHLKAFLLEVNYGPGEASPPHSHPCAVIGYVVEGSIRTQVNGEPERVYQPGETFYEPPNGLHLVSANASSTKPAKLLAYLICDHDAPLSIDVHQTIHQQGDSK